MKLAVRDLRVVYNVPEGELFPVLGPVSFEIEAGSFVCLLGPSGCGKSTLIQVLAGLQRPTSGCVYLDGALINEPASQIGVMFQDPSLMPWRIVLDNIALPLELNGFSRSRRYEIAKKLLPALGLDEFAYAYPGELSGGMAQRVALGRALIHHPEVLLLDEPFGALDALTREQISLDLLEVWEEKRQTILMVTHDINEAVLLSDRIMVMSRRPGRVIDDIDVSLARPRNPDMVYTANFAAIARRIRDVINRQ